MTVEDLTYDIPGGALETVAVPTWSAAQQAIALLNGQDRTLVILGGADDLYLTVGGGDGGLCTVTFTADNEAFFDLLDPPRGEETITMVALGERSAIPAKFCVRRDAALLAAETFFERGERAEGLTWARR